MMPVVASDSAPPSESEMDIAELLKPSLSLVDRARVMTLSRAYIRPMPAPGDHPRGDRDGGRPAQERGHERQDDGAEDHGRADSNRAAVVQARTEPALHRGGGGPRDGAARERQSGEGGREGILLHQQVREVDLGAEERCRGQAARKDDAGEAPAGRQGSPRHQRADGDEGHDDGGDGHDSAGHRKPGGEVQAKHGERREGSPGQPAVARGLARSRGGHVPRCGALPCSTVGRCSDVGCSAQPAQGGHDHQQGRHHQAHHAEEHPVPAEHLRHDAGGEGSHQRGNHPGRGKRGEDLRVQHGRIDPGDHHVQRHGHGAAAQALNQPARHEGRHGRRCSGDQQAQHEHGHGRVQRPHRAAPVGPVAGGHHADDAGGERAGERQGVKGGPVQFPADQRHDRGHRQRFEGGQEHEGAGAQGHQQILAVEDAG